MASIYSTHKGQASRRLTSTVRLAPDEQLKNYACPDVFNVMSWAKQTLNTITTGAAFPPSPKGLGIHAVI
ncbi:MAG: hypothetical protein KR126chlam3_00394 [Chlamydiae bacterium]|nr:hypothetical protein [Chlamydiota bacterium]